MGEKGQSLYILISTDPKSRYKRRWKFLGRGLWGKSTFSSSSKPEAGF